MALFSFRRGLLVAAVALASLVRAQSDGGSSDAGAGAASDAASSDPYASASGSASGAGPGSDGGAVLAVEPTPVPEPITSSGGGGSGGVSSGSAGSGEATTVAGWSGGSITIPGGSSGPNDGSGGAYVPVGSFYTDPTTSGACTNCAEHLHVVLCAPPLGSLAPITGSVAGVSLITAAKYQVLIAASPDGYGLWDKTHNSPDWPQHGILVDAATGTFSFANWQYDASDAMSPYLHAFLIPRDTDTSGILDPEGQPLPTGLQMQVVSQATVKRTATMLCSDGHDYLVVEARPSYVPPTAGGGAGAGADATSSASPEPTPDLNAAANGAAAMGVSSFPVAGAVALAVAALVPRVWA